jgi:hypothetical protein
VLITISVIPPFTYSSQWPYKHGVITVIWGLQIFPCPMNWDMTRIHLATSSVQRTSVLASFTIVRLRYKKVISDARSPSPWVLHSALPPPLELRVADLILQARRRWVATLTSGRRFVGSIRSRVSFGSESPQSSVRIPNTCKMLK